MQATMLQRLGHCFSPATRASSLALQLQRCLATAPTPTPTPAPAPAAYSLIPSAPSWDPQQLAQGGAPPVTDAELARLETLSRLRLSREGGLASPHERARRDVAAVLAAARVLRAAMGAPSAGSSASASSSSSGGAGGGSSGGSSGAGLGALAAHLDSLPEAELEALAVARWARLRADEVTEGGGECITQHASVSMDGYFIVPRFVEE